jgi:GntR family transcriptional repressor for pyruvate dehydrogenase complex
MIIRGELRPGQRLPPERELAALLGVSRPTVREAIRALAVLRIVETRQGAGTSVSSLEPELLAEPLDFLLHLDRRSLGHVAEARVPLEIEVAGLAARRATDDDVRELERIASAAREAVGDVEAFIEGDVAFHAALRRMARSPVLASLVSSLTALSLESRRITGRSEAVRSRSADDHRRILAAVRDRDPDAARRHMALHLEHVLDQASG